MPIHGRVFLKGSKMSIGSLMGLIGALILCGIGAVMIYDARLLTQKWFGFGDQNEGSKIFKLVGFLLTIAGCLLIYWIRK